MFNPLMDRRQMLLFGASASCVVPATWAQPRPARDPRVAAPYLNPAEFVRTALRLHFLPAAQAFKVSSTVLLDQLSAGCASVNSLQNLRKLWRVALLDWERLAAVSVGPLLDRRSSRTLDFWPTRPAMIRSAAQSSPANVGALDRIGAPAKGLPALEWLLWQPQLDVVQCAYATLLAEECVAEAQAILDGFQALAQREWDDENALPFLHEWVGQAVGGLEQLRWKKIGKPARSARKSDWPRYVSGTTRAAWMAQWDGLQRFLLGPANDAELGSLNGLLRGRGLLAISGELERAAVQVYTTLTAADPARPATASAAQRVLAQTKALVEDKAASALQIMVGFSDADGD